MSIKDKDTILAPDISIEEFDHITDGVEDHVFSEKYLAGKEKIMKHNTSKTRATTTHLGVKIAAACAVLVIAAPFAVNAATGGAVEDLIGRIWGNDGKNDIPNHTIHYVEEGKVDKDGNTSSYDINMPKVEYVDIDPEDAARIMDGKVNFEPQSVKFGDYTFSVNAVASDGRSVVVDYTIERTGGVDILNYSQLDNEAKGAWINDDQPYFFAFGRGGKIWVDLEKSTKDKIYCTEYITDTATKSLKLSLTEYEEPRNAMWAKNENINPEDHIKDTKTVDIKLAGVLGQATFTNGGSDSIKISPLSMKIKAGKETLGDEFDPVYGTAIDSTGYIKITYKDGSEYVVCAEKFYDYVHPHDGSKEIANYTYACGTKDNESIFIFNRLVDVDNIAKITVNDTEFTLK